MRVFLFCLGLLAAPSLSVAHPHVETFDYAAVDRILVVDGDRYHTFARFPDFRELRGLMVEAFASGRKTMPTGGEARKLVVVANGEHHVLMLGKDWLNGVHDTVRLDRNVAARMHELLKIQGEGRPVTELDEILASK